MKKSVLNSKIKLLKKSAGSQKCYAQRNIPGVCNISKYRKIGGTHAGLYFKPCYISSKMQNLAANNI